MQREKLVLNKIMNFRIFNFIDNKDGFVEVKQSVLSKLNLLWNGFYQKYLFTRKLNTYFS